MWIMSVKIYHFNIYLLKVNNRNTRTNMLFKYVQKCVKYVHALNIDVSLISLVLTLNIFNTLF